MRTIVSLRDTILSAIFWTDDVRGSVCLSAILQNKGTSHMGLKVPIKKDSY